MNRIVCLLVSLLFSLSIVGCGSEPQPNYSPPPVSHVSFQEDEEVEHLLAFVKDMSGSFSDETDVALSFVGRVMETMFRDRAGSRDRILLSVIGSTEDAVIFEGSQRAFRRKFPTPEEFSKYMKSKSGGGASRVLDSLSDTIEKLCRLHAEKPSMKSSLIVLSDMLDNKSGPNAEARLKTALKEYAQYGGAVGMYWVDERSVVGWQQVLKEAGIQGFFVGSGIRDDQPIPSWN